MEVRATLTNLARVLDAAVTRASYVGVVCRMRAALAGHDVVEYRLTYERLGDLHQRARFLDTRRRLLAKLDAVAPLWADEIRNRRGSHGNAQPPGDALNAWRWRQLYDELERRARVSMEALQSRIADGKRRLEQVTGQLVEARAWAGQVRRTTFEQQQALHGFAAIHKKMPKSGPRVATLKAAAEKLMPICQTAVPVWIMPISRVVETFDPQSNHFDVIVIDEASQADIMSLTALYLAREVVIVGDDKQVTPISVGLDDDVVKALIAAYLDGIPNKILYDGQTSIYTLGETSFGRGTVMLREHFRCVRPIIEFSNQLCYDGKIRPLRDGSLVQTLPHTIAYRVEGGISARKVNEVEARVVASLLMAAAEQAEYDKATFGVISMVGEEQAALIDALLRRYMLPREYVSRAILCGNSAQFQGDERDVVFLSLVDAPSGKGPLPMRREGAYEMFQKRYNVAASRARNQMWVVHSVDPDADLQPDDLRRRLILHARNPFAFTTQLSALEAQTESDFERLVLGHLTRAGYRVTLQHEVGAYRIDIVVVGEGKRLAVECDGDRWHNADNLDQDMERQAVLERLGWKFVRIRGNQFYRDPEKAMLPVFGRLTALGIPAEGLFDDSVQADLQCDQLRQRIEIRAHELRQEWETEERGDAPSIVVPESTVPPEQELPPQAKAANTSSRVKRPKSPPKSEDDPIPPSKTKGDQPVLLPRVQHSLFEDETAPFALFEYLSSRGFSIIDHRTKGGALWVIGDDELEETMRFLHSKGCVFRYTPNGTPATRHRPAWWTRSPS